MSLMIKQREKEAEVHQKGNKVRYRWRRSNRIANSKVCFLYPCFKSPLIQISEKKANFFENSRLFWPVILSNSAQFSNLVWQPHTD